MDCSLSAQSNGIEDLADVDWNRLFFIEADRFIFISAVMTMNRYFIVTSQMLFVKSSTFISVIIEENSRSELRFSVEQVKGFIFSNETFQLMRTPSDVSKGRQMSNAQKTFAIRFFRTLSLSKV